MTTEKTWPPSRALWRALERVERAAVNLTNEIDIEVEEPHWTDRERALMRAIERYEDVAFGPFPPRKPRSPR